MYFRALVLVFALVGCKETTKAEAVDASGGEPTESTASDSASKRDPQIMALAKPALGCKFDDNFDAGCPALNAWRDSDLFKDGKGDETLLSMLGDDDVKMRLLAADHRLSDEVLSDKVHVDRLLEMAGKERNEFVAEAFGETIGRVDVERLGVATQVLDLAKRSSSPFRRGLTMMIEHHPSSPTALTVVKEFLTEASSSGVPSVVFSRLGRAGNVPAVCDFLKEQVQRIDWSTPLPPASLSSCDGMKALVFDEVKKRTKSPTSLSLTAGDDILKAAQNLCLARSTPEAQKKTVFQVVKALTETKVNNRIRLRATERLASCDANAAKPALSSLSKDKDVFVAKEAERQLERLNKSNAQAKK